MHHLQAWALSDNHGHQLGAVTSDMVEPVKKLESLHHLGTPQRSLPNDDRLQMSASDLE